MSTSSRLALSLSAGLLVAACGGGGGGGDVTPTPGNVVTMTVPASLTYGGGAAEVRQSGGVVTPPQSLYAADYGVNEGRTFFVFFVGAGEDREVVSATLRLVPTLVHGDPLQGYTNGFRAEGVNIGADYDAFDYDTPAVGAPSPMGPLPGQTTNVIELDVTEALRAWIGSGSDFFYLRVRLDHLIPNNQSVVGLEFALSGPNGAAFVPTLIAEMRE